MSIMHRTVLKFQIRENGFSEWFAASGQTKLQSCAKLAILGVEIGNVAQD